VTHPPIKYGHLNVSFVKGQDNLIYWNTSAEIFENLGKQKQIIKIFTPETQKDQVCEHLYFSTSIDLCRFSKGVRSNPFMKAFMDGFFKKADHTISKIGLYQLIFIGTKFVFLQFSLHHTQRNLFVIQLRDG
jgi:hypothetical protein